jgi:hypothetical protein
MHNNGTIDQKFMDRSNRIYALERFRILGRSARVRCKGGMIPEFLPPVMSSACELITAVDEWCVYQRTSPIDSIV